MGRKVAYKGKTLFAQASGLLMAQPQTRLVGYGISYLIPPLPTDYYFVVDYQGKYVLDYEGKYVLAKKESIEYGSKSLIKYGKLYAWDDLNFAKEIITGMHVPSDAEWTTLTNYIDSEYNNNPDDFGVGNHLKHPRKDGTPVLSSEYNTSTHPRWDADSTHYGRDTVNFGALPGGTRWSNGSFNHLGTNGYWWSSTEAPSASAWFRRMTPSSGVVDRGGSVKTDGISLRCVRAATAGEQSSYNDGDIIEQVKDYDDNVYDCILIGTQVWTKQNIAATRYMDGTSVTCYDYDDDDSNTFFDSEEDSIW